MAIRPGLKIGRVLGIPIYIHSTWLFIFALITYSLAVRFTQEHPQWTTTQHWPAGMLTSVLFFRSVIFHELSHSLVAKHYKMPVASMTLFNCHARAPIGPGTSAPVTT